MSKLRCHIAISADGFVAGPNQSEKSPLGEGGERLHSWMVSLAAWRQSHGHQGGEVNESARIVEESLQNVGAGVMGRNMFGPAGGGDWGDGQWKGWWGDDPPYHHDVFILTHHPRELVEMEGGTTFQFVTDGIERALEHKRREIVEVNSDILDAPVSLHSNLGNSHSCPNATSLTQRFTRSAEIAPIAGVEPIVRRTHVTNSAGSKRSSVLSIEITCTGSKLRVWRPPGLSLS